jgi:hypothetical protein
MGTDIHFYVERRVSSGEWVSADTWEPDEYWEKDGTYGAVPLTVRFGKHFYDARNYDLFAILADVRNGSGFAGCDTGDGFNVIAQPRGLPDDMSPELAEYARRRCDHTPSWLLVSEIMAFDWTQTTIKRGWVSGPQFEKWTRWNRSHGLGPTDYCGGVSGRDIRHISAEEMEWRVKDVVASVMGFSYAERDKVIAGLKNFYCLVSWETPYYREAAHFLGETLPRLWRLGKPDDVRCVFWFDS